MVEEAHTRYMQAQVMDRSSSREQRLQALVEMIFGRQGLDLQYDANATYTVGEVWQQRRANCLAGRSFGRSGFGYSQRCAGLEQIDVTLLESAGIGFEYQGHHLRHANALMLVLERDPVQGFAGFYRAMADRVRRVPP